MTIRNYLAFGCCALFGVLLSAACGGVSVQQGCSDRAKAECAKIDQCRKNGTQVTYGTLGNCITQQTNNCITSLAAPGTSADANFQEACAMAMPNESCQDYLQNNPPPDCIPKNGSLPDGTACAFNAQCQNGFCAIASTAACGVCQGLPKPGDPCTSNGCGRNLACTPNQTCAPYVANGGACDGKNNVCAPGSACVIASGQTAGTCQAKIETAGTACDSKLQTAPNCDSNAGLFCSTTSKTCVAYSYANAGAGCGASIGDTMDTLCNGGAACLNPDGSGNMCVPPANPGDSCDTVMGPPCFAPARCVISDGSTSGTCTLLDGTMCM